MAAALLFGVLLAQTVTASPESTEATQIARIRKALAEPPALETKRVERGDRPVFRLVVTGRKPDKPLWDDWSAVPSYIRPSMSLYHYEFLSQVTPEFFRASVLYPGYPMTPYGGLGIGVPLVPLFEAAAKGMEKMNRHRQEESAREVVRKALEDLQNAKDREPAVRTIVRSGVELRVVTVNVTGEERRSAAKAGAADFTILEDGVPQTVTHFVKNTDNPKTTRYQLGYVAPPSRPGDTKHIEVRVRGIRRTITHDFVMR